jgi:hypothetical protein
MAVAGDVAADVADVGTVAVAGSGVALAAEVSDGCAVLVDGPACGVWLAADAPVGSRV